MEYIYLIRLGNTDDYKIGYSKKPEARRKGLQTANGEPLEIVKEIAVNFGFKVESFLHKYYYSKRKLGEWFELDDEDLLKFEEICLRQSKALDFLSVHNTYYKDRGDRF